MALAVKDATETAPLDRLAVSSLVGLAYVLGSIGVVFYAIPGLWGNAGVEAFLKEYTFVSGALLILLMVGAAVGLAYLGARLVAFDPPRGLRAGMFIAAAMLFATGLVTWVFGRFLQWVLGGAAGTEVIGGAITAAVGALMLFWLGRKFFRPEMEDRFLNVEEQGWFTLAPYKKSQGVRVRRGTMLGILILLGCGIWVLISHNTLVFDLDPTTSVLDNDWRISIPFSYISPLVLRDVRFSLPLLLAALALWFSYRVVHWPAFADFLIATEAELNKVSWTSRKRLVQDTIVVLTTVILLTLFLFVVDILWGFLLTRVGVLQTTTQQQQEQRTGQTPW
jgi:preprotein translocase SecE subunit